MRAAIKYLIVFSLLLSTLWGCSKKGTVVVPDKEPPRISVTLPTPSQTFLPGGTITFQATFSDNVKLKSYGITVSKRVTSGLILKIVPISEDFSFSRLSINFPSGVKQQDINLNDIVIPLNTATKITTPGDYNFTVTCVDDAGNNAIPETRVIKIN